VESGHSGELSSQHEQLFLGCDAGGGLPLWSEDEGPNGDWPVELPAALKSALMSWNERGTKMIARLDLYDPQERVTMITSFNREGRAFAERIAEALNGSAKIRFLAEPE
jgi:hypothetical protein